MSDFAVYVHWPYCGKICPYCDFNVYRARDLDPAPLLAAIAADLAAHRALIGPREAVSVFLGGGTPSLLTGREVGAVLAAIDAAFPLASGCEVTLEANPEDRERFAEHAAAGINRFSIGVQALDDAALKALGRWHSAAESVAAVEAAARTGRRVSLDLIYAREGQTLDAWEAELKQALTLPVEHVSLYQLTIEPGTAFAHAAARGRALTPDVEGAADFFERTQASTEAAGFPAYEISNHARSAAAHSRHNLVYWRGGEWVGVGPGAHGRLVFGDQRWATHAARRPADYIAAVSAIGRGWREAETLAGEAVAQEWLLMGLRLREGVEVARIERARGRPLSASALSDLSELGLIREGYGRLQLSAEGRLVADRVAAMLLEA